MTSGLRAVEAAVENVKEAVGQAVHSVLTHIPGTPEHAVAHDLKEVEKEQQKKGVQFQEGAEPAAAQPTTRGKPVRKLGRQATPWIGSLPDMEPEAGASSLDHIAEEEEEEEEGGEAAAEAGQQKGVRFQEGGEGSQQAAAGSSSRRKKLGRQATPWIGSFPDVGEPEEEEGEGKQEGAHSLDQIAEDEGEEGAEQQQQQQQAQSQQAQQQKGVRFQEAAGQQPGSEHRSKSLTRKATPWLGGLVTEAEPSAQHAEHAEQPQHAEHGSLGLIEEGAEEAEEAGEGEQAKGVRFAEGAGQPNGAARSKSLTRQPTPWVGELPQEEEEHSKSVRFAAEGEEQSGGQPEGLPKSKSLTRKPTPYIGAIPDAELEQGAEGLDRLSLSETTASKPAKP